MKILVTGGAGYIGSHTCIELLEKGYEIIIADNFSNSSPEVLNRIKKITGRDVKSYNADLTEREKLETIFQENSIDAVIHFAGLKAVGESVQIPLKYYHNNITGTLILCELMEKYSVKKMVFSSSATVYGTTNISPLGEELPLSATNPYGHTKLMIEQILKDIYVADNSWSIVLLRYFNPIGAHKSGSLGENPKGVPNNLMPYITQVAVGKLKELSVFGNNYDTKDGTGVRDYIHVTDLAKGHVKAIEYVNTCTGVEAINLGTGKGYSVLELVGTFSKVNGIEIPYKIVEARVGDIGVCYANPKKAEKLLDWRTEETLEDMCRDSWNWQKANPNGYEQK